MLVFRSVLVNPPLLCVLHQQAHTRRDLHTLLITIAQETPTLIRIIASNSQSKKHIRLLVKNTQQRRPHFEIVVPDRSVIQVRRFVGEEHATKAACMVLIGVPTIGRRVGPVILRLSPPKM